VWPPSRISSTLVESTTVSPLSFARTRRGDGSTSSSLSGFFWKPGAFRAGAAVAFMIGPPSSAVRS